MDFSFIYLFFFARLSRKISHGMRKKVLGKSEEEKRSRKGEKLLRIYILLMEMTTDLMAKGAFVTLE